MAMVTYPLNNVQYTAEDAELYNAVRMSGVWSGSAFDAEVTGNDTIVTIGEGIAWIANTKFSGKVVAQKEPKAIDLGIADPSYNRVDVIAIQFDSVENKTDIVVKKGIATSSPEMPARSTTESIYELYLYSVLRTAGSSVISKSNVTDLRDNREYCGYMQDTIKPGYAPSLMEHNKKNDFRFWVGTNQEYQEQKNNIPENTFCVITDDPNDNMIDYLITNTGRTGLASGADLNNYTYCCRLNCIGVGNGVTVKNSPTTAAFTMDVVSGMGIHTKLVEGKPYEYLLQKIITYTGDEYFRYVYTDGYGKIKFSEWSRNMKASESIRSVNIGTSPIQYDPREFAFFIGYLNEDGVERKIVFTRIDCYTTSLDCYARAFLFHPDDINVLRAYTLYFHWGNGGYILDQSYKTYNVETKETFTNPFAFDKIIGFRVPGLGV